MSGNKNGGCGTVADLHTMTVSYVGSLQSKSASLFFHTIYFLLNEELCINKYKEIVIYEISTCI